MVLLKDIRKGLIVASLLVVGAPFLGTVISSAEAQSVPGSRWIPTGLPGEAPPTPTPTPTATPTPTIVPQWPDGEDVSVTTFPRCCFGEPSGEESTACCSLEGSSLSISTLRYMQEIVQNQDALDYMRRNPVRFSFMNEGGLTFGLDDIIDAGGDLHGMSTVCFEYKHQARGGTLPVGFEGVWAHELGDGFNEFLPICYIGVTVRW